MAGEIPEVAADQDDQLAALKRIIRDNLLWEAIQDGVVDYSKTGSNILKLRFDDGRGVIENIPPKYWYPVVSISNIKQIDAHIIAYTFNDPAEKRKDISYLKVEIHRPPADGEESYVIEHRLYMLKSGKIDSEPLPLNSFPEFAGLLPIEPTGLDDFDIIDIQNKPETDQLIGTDDYTDINSILHEILMRYAQIFRIEDKFADPSMYGPPIEEQDPRNGEYRIIGGSRYITVVEGQVPPGIIDGRGPPVTSYTSIEHLMQRLYEVSETCKVAFDASQAGTALSGTALKLMMSRPLSKAGGIKLRYDARLKKAIKLCSRLEVYHGMPGAVEITDFHINWKDGLQQDDMLDAQRQATLIGAQAMSPQDAMRERGMSEEQITRAMKDIREPAIPEPGTAPKLRLPALGEVNAQQATQ